MSTEAVNEALSNLNLSTKEAEGLCKAFQDSQFEHLLGDYIKSLHDPKTKQEAEEYLRELEQDGQWEEVVGNGTVIAVPSPSYVVKTKDASSQRKFFVNICTTDKVGQATCKRARNASTGRTGVMWDFPFVMSNIRPGKDSQGAACDVVDVVVHPETVVATTSQQPVKDLLVDAILDRAQVQCERNLSRRYTCPRMRFKTTSGVGKPPLVVIKASSTLENQQPHKSVEVDVAQQQQQLAGKAGDQAAACTDKGNFFTGFLSKNVAAQDSTGRESSAISRPKSCQEVPQCVDTPVWSAARHQEPGTAEPSGRRSRFRFPAAADPPVNTITSCTDNGSAACPSTLGLVGSQREKVPRYTVVHRGRVELGAAWRDAGRGLHMGSSRPKELVIHIDLPGVESLNATSLEVSNCELHLLIPGQYALELQLPFIVKGEKATAKFVHDQQQLQILVPVEQDCGSAGKLQQDNQPRHRRSLSMSNDVQNGHSCEGPHLGESQIGNQSHGQTSSSNDAETSQHAKQTKKIAVRANIHARLKQCYPGDQVTESAINQSCAAHILNSVERAEKNEQNGDNIPEQGLAIASSLLSRTTAALQTQGKEQELILDCPLMEELD